MTVNSTVADSDAILNCEPLPFILRIPRVHQYIPDLQLALKHLTYFQVRKARSEISRPQRASVVMRLAHISKKSMVWDPWRGVSRGELPDREPGREELSWGRSMAGLAESMLSRGRWRPAVEPDRWGVDDPDLKPTASMMSSVGNGREDQQSSTIK